MEDFGERASSTMIGTDTTATRKQTATNKKGDLRKAEPPWSG